MVTLYRFVVEEKAYRRLVMSDQGEVFSEVVAIVWNSKQQCQNLSFLLGVFFVLLLTVFAIKIQPVACQLHNDQKEQRQFHVVKHHI